MQKPVAVHRSPFPERYPLSINGKCSMGNGKLLKIENCELKIAADRREAG